MSSESAYERPVIIHKTDGFTKLYADTGIPEAKAPRHRDTVKFKIAIEQFDDDDLAAIREYDRARSGGMVNG
jgi:hypothetical protein